jgi:flagellar protein FliS
MADGRLAAYQTVQTTTADPGRLVLMLLDGATRFLHQAGRALDRGDVTAFAESVCRAHAIIAELSGALDREAGGEVAANLARLYDFMLWHLNAGMSARSRRHLDDVLRPLAALRAGFEGAVQATHV